MGNNIFNQCGCKPRRNVLQRGDKKIIEETPPQVTTNDASPRFKDREIHVRRLNKADELALTPVIDAATNYLNEKEPYDKSGLYIIGVLLIYKRFTPDTFLQKVIVKILKRLLRLLLIISTNMKRPERCQWYALNLLLNVTRMPEIIIT